VAEVDEVETGDGVEHEVHEVVSEVLEELVPVEVPPVAELLPELAEPSTPATRRLSLL